MTRNFFGTDGIRGTANVAPMTADIALAVGRAAGAEFTRGGHRHRVVIGKDTRLSGYMLEPALTAGFISVGMDVFLLGPLPTPAVAMLTRSMRADLGVVISASHNPYQDNGIKLFGPDGFKLSDEVEARIEQRMQAYDGLAEPSQLGRAQRLDDAVGRYIESVKSSFPKGLTLDGLRVVVDCAHGAAYKVAPLVLRELGAEVIAIGVEPNGFNINQDCGSTYPAAMQAAVRAHKADFGLALDGDADRVVMADETGSLLDGDQLMALIASVWQRTGRLRGEAICATVMSNLGLERYLGGLGLSLVRTNVGDRYVTEKMRESGINVGGEQSGHIVLSDYATTGDGLIAALQVLAACVEARKPASAVARLFTPVPQLLKNVSAEPSALEAQAVRRAVREAEAALGNGGRLLVRPSGTEPLVRVMAEGDDQAVVAAAVERVVSAIVALERV
ncbi:MAG: phosphoglucosamine mutase [Gemmatimonas sp.]